MYECVDEYYTRRHSNTAEQTRYLQGGRTYSFQTQRAAACAVQSVLPQTRRNVGVC